MTPREVLALCREKDVKAVDLRFCDLFGAWRCITLPVGRLTEEVFEEGWGFDGSRFRGWQSVAESDMLLLPEADTAFVDPCAATPTLGLVCNVQDPVTGEPYSRDPRYIAAKAVNYLKVTGIADAVQFGLSVQFFVFERNASCGHVEHAASPAISATSDLSDGAELLQTLTDAGLVVDAFADLGGGKGQVGLKQQPLVKTADWLMSLKSCVHAFYAKQGKTATFMPQPIADVEGAALRTHLSLWKGQHSLFSGSGYSGLSEAGLYALGGILRHAPALVAFTSPTTNSYRRLSVGGGGPIHLVYGQRNRSAAVRIPAYTQSPQSKRIEFRCPDPTANPYLALAAILMAAIDGIQLKLSPGAALDQDVSALSGEQLAETRRTPGTLDDALSALEADSEFLLRDEVFTQDVIDTWVTHKRDGEVDPLRSQPHPLELEMYFDA